MKNIRVFYRKFGKLKYISHLDMNRVFSRILRRAKIPIWYTEGFNPHPRTNFALPLSLGFESDYEVVDIRIDDDEYIPDEMLRQLKTCEPEGIEFCAAAEPVMKVGDISAAQFDIFTILPERTEEFFEQSSIEVEKKTKKGEMKKLDIRPLIKSYNITQFGLSLTLAAGNENLNPMLVLDALSVYTGAEVKPQRIIRRAIFGLSGEKFV